MPGLLKSVIITGGTSIGRLAFANCDGLTSISIPESVTSIGERAFVGCSGLEIIDVNENNTTYHSEGNCLIETASKKLVFAYKNFIIPNNGSVTGIGDYAFYGCDGLTSITIPDSVTSIGNSAFSWCSGLTSITIPDNLTSIGRSAFSWCSGLTSITIPDSVTNIGEEAFDNCSGLEMIDVNENNTVYHSKGNCLIETASKTLILGFKNSIIPDDGSVTRIGEKAFYNCTGLTSITIPMSVTFIGKGAFYGCSNLTSMAFVCTTGWSKAQSENWGSTSIVVTNASTNANNLKADSYNFWKRTV
jgi:hypothetical protein